MVTASGHSKYSSGLKTGPMNYTKSVAIIEIGRYWCLASVNEWILAFTGTISELEVGKQTSRKKQGSHSSGKCTT